MTARLELPAEHVELAAAYLAGEIDSATYEQRLLALVARQGESRSPHRLMGSTNLARFVGKAGD